MVNIGVGILELDSSLSWKRSPKAIKDGGKTDSISILSLKIFREITTYAVIFCIEKRAKITNTPIDVAILIFLVCVCLADI